MDLICGDTLFWTFSTLLQTLAATVAALIAGYTIVVMISDKQEQKYVSLSRFFDKYRAVKHSKLKRIFVWLSICIVSDTIIIATTNNKSSVSYGTIIICIIIIYTNIYTLITSLISILSLINTTEDKNVAAARIKEIISDLGSKNKKISSLIYTDKRKVLLDLIAAIKEKYCKISPIYDDYDNRRIVNKLLIEESIQEDVYLNFILTEEIYDMIIMSSIYEVDECVFDLLDGVFKKIDIAKNFLKTGRNVSVVWITPQDKEDNRNPINIYTNEEYWIKEPFLDEYLLEYEVTITDRIQGDISPDIRLILAPNIRAYPRIAIICPWQYDSNYPGHREAHIVIHDPRIVASGLQDDVLDQHVRLLRRPVSRIDVDLDSFTATLLITEQELKFKADFFEDKESWLTVEKKDFDRWNYPYKTPQFIGVFTHNTNLQIRIKNAIQMTL